jgi:hypothetical protein
MVPSPPRLGEFSTSKDQASAHQLPRGSNTSLVIKRAFHRISAVHGDHRHEGLNNKIKVLKRIAYGYRDVDFFQLRVLFIHEVETKATGV